MSSTITTPASSSRSVTPAPMTKINHNRAFSRSNLERFTFTLGKLDAGMAILLGPNAHILEFPSLLLPTPSPGQPPLGPGSILTITVSRDLQAEKAAEDEFNTLQSDILATFSKAPSTPVLKLRNVTQTSVCVEWDALNLGSAGFRGMEMYRNGQRWGRVGGERERGKKEKREWKTGGLQSGEEYTFQLILKTTAGTYSSNVIRVRTHTMDNLTGLYIKFGPIQPPQLLDRLKSCLEEIGARESPSLALDTTHFVCTTPLVGGDDKGRGGNIDADYAQAARANLPIVGPDWLLAVARERKLVPISNYLLPPPPADAAPSSNPAPFKRPEPLKRASLPFPSSAPSSPILERSFEEIRRSPSPETIARMSMTGPAAGGSNRSETVDKRRSREGSLPVAPMERRRSREASLPAELTEQPRPRSPKPETDGKLDRKFKFPLKSDSASSSPTTPTGPSSVPNSASTKGEDGPPSPVPEEPASDQTSEPGPIEIPPITVSSVVAEPASIGTPSPPIVTVTPPSETKETVPEHESSHASTIDEAIAEFNEAVGKPKEEEKAEDSTIVPALTPIEEIMAETPNAEEGLEEASVVKSKEPKDIVEATEPESTKQEVDAPVTELTAEIEEQPVEEKPKKKKSKGKKKKEKKSTENVVAVDEPKKDDVEQGEGEEASLADEGTTMDEIDLN